MIKLALSGFLFEDNYQTQSVTFENFCHIAASAGYSGVELRNTQIGLNSCKTERNEKLEIINKHGMEVTCLTARNLPDKICLRDKIFEDYLELCSDLNCKLLKISSDFLWLKRGADKAEKYNITLAVNNHIGSMLETVEGTRDFFRILDCRNIMLLYDPFHLMVNGEDYINCIPDLAPLTAAILMQSAHPVSKKNCNQVMIKGRCWERSLPDADGTQNWSMIFDQFKAQKYNRIITVIENSWPKENREAIARYNVEYLRREQILR